jgi:hypothetical protein
MPYIGNQPQYTSFLTDTFSGNGVTTNFSMRVAPANPAAAIVAIWGILQDPSTYSVIGNALVFSQAPPAGPDNISVRYLSLPASNVVTGAYRSVTDITATAGQTTFSTSSYTPGFVEVFRNGVRLGSSNYTATSGVTVVLGNPANAGDLVTVVSFFVSSVLNAIPGTAGSVTANNLDTSQQGGVGAMTVPTGSTGQRPVGPITGMVRFNSLTSGMEYYDGRAWLGMSEISSYITAATGGTITTSGNFRIHTFNSSDNFVVNTVIGAGTVEYLIIGGGGGGGFQFGGGGGAGGFLTGTVNLTAGTYAITVGGGGSTDTTGLSSPRAGSNSSAFGITSFGGAGGVSGLTSAGNTAAFCPPGGSGGGGGNYSSVSLQLIAGQMGGKGTSGQGNDGGHASWWGSNNWGGGGGGGGAGFPGGGARQGNGPVGFGGFGGNGRVSSISGVAQTYAGGGAGGGHNGTESGGSGGGGTGGWVSGAAVNGTGNTGGGGGGGGGTSTSAGNQNGASGGSGVVIIRYRFQ